MEFYYRVYDQFLRKMWSSCLYVPISVGAGYGTSLITGNEGYGEVVFMGILVLRLLWVQVWRLTLRCPHCRRRSLALLPDLNLFRSVFEDKPYTVRCWRCKETYETDLARQYTRFSLKEPYIRTRGTPEPGAFTAKEAYTYVISSVVASAILVAIFYLKIL